MAKDSGDSTRKDRKLKNLIIDASFQSKIIVLIVGFVILQSILVTWYLMYFSRYLGSLVVDGVANCSETTEMFGSLVIGVTIANVGFILFSLVLSLYFSHKIAGPIYAIKRAINNLLEGVDSREIILRKGDEFQDLANRINKLFSLFNIASDIKKGDEKDGNESNT